MNHVCKALKFVIWMTLWFRKRTSISTVGLKAWTSKVHVSKNGCLTFGGRAILSARSEIKAAGGIVTIGAKFFLNEYSRIISMNRISIGSNVTIAKFVAILDHDHNMVYDNGNLSFEGYVTESVSIGNNVWIGDKATIVKGCTIGNNVIIAANAVVTGTIPDNCLAGGIPARVLKQFRPTVE